MSSGPLSARAIANGSLLGAALGILWDSQETGRILTCPKTTGGFLRGKGISNGVLASGILVWPVLFDLAVGYDQIVENPLLALGLVGPMVLSAMQLLSTRPDNDEAVNPSPDTRRSEAGIIISAALSIGLLLLNSQNREAIADGMRLLVVAVLLSLLVVVPTTSLSHRPSGSHAVVASTQRTSLNFALGFLLTGVLIAMLRQMIPKTAAKWPESVAGA